MKDDKREGQSPATGGSIPNRILGSLRDALAAASRDATGEITVGVRTEILPKDAPPAAKAAPEMRTPAAAPPPPAAAVVQSAAEAPPPITTNAPAPTTLDDTMTTPPLLTA